MQRAFLFIVLNFVILNYGAFAEHQVGNNGQPRPAADAGDSLHRHFNSFFSRTMPGCSFSVERNGINVFSRAYGASRLLSRGQPENLRILNTPQRRMRIASVSKPVLAMAAMVLRDQLMRRNGEDLLNLSLGEIYPRHFRGTRFERITVRQIMNHTSGLELEPASIPASDADLPRLMARSPRSWLTGDRPAARFNYSNVGYMLLGDIIRQKAGMDWKTFVRQNIFDPLEMRSSNFEDPVPLIARGTVAEGYAASGNGFETQTIDRSRRNLLGSGGLITTSEDLIKLTDAVRNKRLLSEDSWGHMTHSSSAALIRGSPYGLGWSVAASGEDLTLDHDGAGYGSATLMKVIDQKQPECKLGLAILCNFDEGAVDNFTLDAAATRIQTAFCR